MLTRRIFLRGSALVMAGMGSTPLWLARAAAAEGKKRKTLVAIFQRGAADGLNIVVPFNDKRYHELRPSIGLNVPVQRNNGNGGIPINSVIDLDGTFGFHASLEPLKSLWDKGQLAVVEATGSPDSSRSHFDAQDYMESGTTSQSLDNGWLNRALPHTEGGSAFRAVALGNQLPRTLRGDNEALSVGNLQQFTLGNSDAASILQNMYASTPDLRVGRAGKDAFEAIKLVQSLPPITPAGRGGAVVPAGAVAGFVTGPGNPRPPQYQQGGELGANLQQLARLIKAEAGVEAAFTEIQGWDHHGTENQQMQQVLRQFSSAIGAFCNDMGDRMEDIVLVTMSEFGRTAAENGNAGTDHGHGSLMMVMGGPVQGGKIYGKWSGLEKEQLFEGRDLAVTTDYRAVLSELVRGHLGQQDLSQVFPGFTPGDPLGLLKA